MSFWLARGGVFGLSMLKLALMRSRACLPSDGGFPRDGGSEQPHRAVFFRQLGLELARLGQLRADVGPPWW
jgi:hypothetical protein